MRDVPAGLHLLLVSVDCVCCRCSCGILCYQTVWEMQIVLYFKKVWEHMRLRWNLRPVMHKSWRTLQTDWILDECPLWSPLSLCFECHLPLRDASSPNKESVLWYRNFATPFFTAITTWSSHDDGMTPMVSRCLINDDSMMTIVEWSPLYEGNGITKVESRLRNDDDSLTTTEWWQCNDDDGLTNKN